MGDVPGSAPEPLHRETGFFAFKLDLFFNAKNGFFEFEADLVLHVLSARRGALLERPVEKPN